MAFSHGRAEVQVRCRQREQRSQQQRDRDSDNLPHRLAVRAASIRHQHMPTPAASINSAGSLPDSPVLPFALDPPSYDFLQQLS